MLTQLPVCRTNRTGWSFATLLLTAAVLALILVNVPRLAAQPAQAPGMDECSGGTLYYLAFPDTVTNAQDSRFKASYPEEFYLYIYSPVNQQVKIGRANGASLSINVTGGDILEFDTKAVAVPLITTRNAPQTNVLKVESESPVIIYAYMATRFGCAAFTPVPVEGWGMRYYAATWEGEYVRNIVPAGETNFDASVKVPAPAEILVIAAEDNTQVTINPTGSLASCSTCTRVTLRAGEAYLVQSFVDTNEGVERQADIAGSVITSSKPIGVITANTRMGHAPSDSIALARNSYKDLAAEWLAPADQHGTEFVFLPMWDDFRQRPGADPARKTEYVRVYATTSRQTEVRDPFGNTVAGRFNNGEYMNGVLADLRNAVYYRTTQPGQAFQSPGAVVKFNGTTGSGNFIGVSYKSWGTSTVEIVPREQWTSFAPFKAPAYPFSMKHYLNVVTDTGNQFNVYYRSGSGGRQLFPFNRGRIAGTDLVWGSIIVNPGLNYVLESLDDGRFSGYVYGVWGGYELYRPGGAKDEEKGQGTSSAHPSEYEENTAMTYAYPLAPSRCMLAEPNQYRITVSQDGCNRLCVSVEPTNDTPAGLEFVRLVDDRSVTFNTRLEFIEPPRPEPGMLSARFCLVPVNPQQPARAVVEVRDRTRNGQIYRIPFVYDPEVVKFGPGTELDFGKVPVGKDAGEREVTIVNPTNRPVAIRRLLLFLGNQNFIITRTSPAVDWTNGNNADTLAPGDTLRVWINITAAKAKQIYHDSLVVELGCGHASFPLRAQSGGEACLIVGDLDFGRVPAGERKILPLEICNVGDAEVSFHDSSATGGGFYLSWLGSEFYVANSEISKLKNAVLGPGECITIVVSFSSEIDGLSRTVARFWANTRECRDTSIWSAYVSGISGVDERGDASGYAIGAIAPNPFSRATEIPFTLGKGGMTRVEIYNTEGVLITRLLEESLSAGEHRVEWDAGEYPAGRYFVRITSGEWNDSRSLWLVR